ncbi:Putative Phosphate acetyl/butyryltransferase (plasmid) [Mesorhizobium loti]|nr:Putative Phosphate acetyl/butyryltransferase [Mesorhizobium loti]
MLGAQLPKVAARVCLATVRVGYAARTEGATACRTASRYRTAAKGWVTWPITLQHAS